MATISQILGKFWPGSEWILDAEDYTTLNWMPGNVAPKPTEAEILARSAETDTLLASEAKLRREQNAMQDTPDYLLKVVETQIDALIEIRRVVNDLRSTIVSAAHTGDFTAWDSDVVSRVTALRQWVTNKRNTP